MKMNVLKWVKCSSRMPEPDGPEVLVWDGAEFFVAHLELREEGPSDIERAYWKPPSGSWYVDLGDWWALLPEPPGREDEGEL